MNHQSIGLLSGIIGFTAINTAAEPVQPDIRRPNIIYFLMDDMGYGDSVVYNPESKLSLPNVEGLARDGMMFADAHSPSSVCAPTRYSILTGNYPWRGRNPWGTWAFNRPSQILPGQETLGHLLRRAGYRNAFIGKVHLGGTVYDRETGEPVRDWRPDFTRIDWRRPIEDGPLDQGFDYSYILPNGIQGRPYAYFENDILLTDPDRLMDWEVGQYDLSVIQAPGFGDANWDSSEAGPRLTRSALQFIDRHFAANARDGVERPFFMYYASQACHTPHTPPEELMGVPIRGTSNIDYHLDLIIEADVTLGKMIAKLKEHDALDNTMIIFTSDNGGLIWGEAMRQGHHSSGPLRGGKASVWEGGHRVPLVVRLGNGTPEGSVIPPGSVSHALVGLHDFYATFAEMTGQSLAPDQGLDSFSIWDELRGIKDAPVRRHLLVQSNTEDTPGQRHMRMWRDGPWKLIISRELEALKLFNLDEDLAETTNLIDEPAQGERVLRMEREVREVFRGERSTPIPQW